ncbi:MAG: D-glycero-beta-D-manno-heptose-7-phosphate kinase [Desulfobacteraceae bacterium]|nr:MAG: D-glycero-beta-D-manno-heptose-7-phosphate kinase [Desulfobacteraceae bacterium]
MIMDVDISKFKDCRVLVIGDLMIDEYLWGDVDRISPEAPVQVVAVKKEESTLGGSGNVVNNLAALGAKVFAVGVIGAGGNGDFLLERFGELGVDTEGIVRERGRPTTKKTRIIAAHQHVLRIDRETRKEISGETLDKIAGFIRKKIAGADVVIVSDYGKGLITKSLMAVVVKYAKKYGKITIADPKGLDYSKYSGVTLITPNRKEAALAAGVEITNNQSLIEAGTKIIESHYVEKLLVTCGKDGMTLFEKGKKPCKIRAEARQVFDVSGAGDTVVAVLALAVASGASFKTGAAVANSAAGIVVGKVGTATVSAKELAAALVPQADDHRIKHKSLSELPDLIRELRKKDKKIVLTNGCFDLLHAGHVMLFSASKKQGDVLIVAIDDDESVRRLKGRGRPVIRAGERVRILSALDSVDYVVVFQTAKLSDLIETVRPDVLTKGSNYSSEEVYGREIVEKHGGRVALIPVNKKVSATRIIDSIIKSGSG